MFGFGGDLKRRRAIIENSFASQTELIETHFKIFKDGNLHIGASAWQDWEITAFVAWAFYMGIVNCGGRPNELPKLQEALNLAIAHYLQKRLFAVEPSLVEPGHRARFQQIVANLQSRAGAYNEAFERDKVGVIDAERRGEMYVPGVQLLYLLLQNCLVAQADVDRIHDYSILHQHLLPQAFNVMSSMK